MKAPTAPTAPKAPTAGKTAPAPTPVKTDASTEAKADTPATASGFKLETGIALPPRARLTGGSSKASPYPFKDMPINSSFLVTAEVPENTKDEERDAVFKDVQRKVANRMSGAIRRFKKSNPGYDFSSRSVASDELGYGVRVWRVEPGQGDGDKE